MAFISKFYENRNILVIGATGFLGKILVEKCLRSCPDIKRVYVLIRPKRGQDVEDRLHQLLNSTAFDLVRKEKPDSLKKVVALCGDVTEPVLGLSSENQNLLKDDVSVVFHSAASIKLDQPLNVGTKVHVSATRNVLKLCDTMTNLKAVVHVSTAFCHCHQDILGEVITPMSPTANQVIDAMSWMDRETIERITPKLLDGRPNTYLYTKALTEDLIRTEFGHLPIAVFRPSAIESSWREPFPGWVDNFSATNGITANVMLGALQCLRGDARSTIDLIPVDICVNMMLGFAWHVASTKPKEIPVFNCSTSHLNPLSMGEFTRYIAISAKKTPVTMGIPLYPNCIVIKNKLIYNIASLFLHWLPAIFIDGLSLLTGRKPKVIKLQKRVQKQAKELEPFLLKGLNCKTNNLVNIWETMSEEDQKIFYFDVREIDWSEHKDICLGVRTYLFKEDPSTLLSARRRRFRNIIVIKIFSLVIILGGSLNLLLRTTSS